MANSNFFETFKFNLLNIFCKLVKLIEKFGGWFRLHQRCKHDWNIKQIETKKSEAVLKKCKVVLNSFLTIIEERARNDLKRLEIRTQMYTLNNIFHCICTCIEQPGYLQLCRGRKLQLSLYASAHCGSSMAVGGRDNWLSRLWGRISFNKKFWLLEHDTQIDCMIEM